MATSLAARSFPVLYVRGGMTKGLVVMRHHLPADPQEWLGVLSGVVGGGAPREKLVDGLSFGTVNSIKVAVLGPAAPGRRADADVEFTLLQISKRNGRISMASSLCPDLASVLGPISVDEGLVKDVRIAPDLVDSTATGNSSSSSGGGSGSSEVRDAAHQDYWSTFEPKPKEDAGGGKQQHAFRSIRQAEVRIFNTNTSRLVHARFDVTKDLPRRYVAEGGYTMHGGVGAPGSRIRLQFVEPAGVGTGRRRVALPTGRAMDLLRLPRKLSFHKRVIPASLVDVCDPAIFVRAADMMPDWSNARIIAQLTPLVVSRNAELRARLEVVRREGAFRMGVPEWGRGGSPDDIMRRADDEDEIVVPGADDDDGGGGVGDDNEAVFSSLPTTTIWQQQQHQQQQKESGPPRQHDVLTTEPLMKSAPPRVVMLLPHQSWRGILSLHPHTAPRLALDGVPPETERETVRCLAVNARGYAHTTLPLPLAMCAGAACKIMHTLPFNMAYLTKRRQQNDWATAAAAAEAEAWAQTSQGGRRRRRRGRRGSEEDGGDVTRRREWMQEEAEEDEEAEAEERAWAAAAAGQPVLQPSENGESPRSGEQHYGSGRAFEKPVTIPERVLVGYPSGLVEIKVPPQQFGMIKEAFIWRTARVLMKGDLFY